MIFVYKYEEIISHKTKTPDILTQWQVFYGIFSLPWEEERWIGTGSFTTIRRSSVASEQPVTWNTEMRSETSWSWAVNWQELDIGVLTRHVNRLSAVGSTLEGCFDWVAKSSAWELAAITEWLFRRISKACTLLFFVDSLESKM